MVMEPFAFALIEARVFSPCASTDTPSPGAANATGVAAANPAARATAKVLEAIRDISKGVLS